MSGGGQGLKTEEAEKRGVTLPSIQGGGLRTEYSPSYRGGDQGSETQMEDRPGPRPQVGSGVGGARELQE